MTIRHPNGFHALPPAGFDGVFHWDFLDSAWRRALTGISPMDIDAVVERNGSFLMFETKSPGVLIPDGQRRALSQLVNLGRGAITLIHLQCKSATDIDGWDVWRYPDPRDRYSCVGDASALFQFCEGWFARASGDHNWPPLTKSFEDVVGTISERKANGGAGWERK